MRAWIVVFICLLGFLPVRAQELSLWRSLTRSSFTTPQGMTHTLNFNLSRQLSISAAESYHHALLLSRHLPPDQFVIMGNPTKSAFDVKHLDPRAIYPDLPFLKTSRQTANYMVKQTNRLYIRETKQLSAVWEAIHTYMPTFQQLAAKLPQPENIPQWLAADVPQHTKNLFIGEIHNYSEIPQAIADCLAPLRARFAARKIFLFTEFLPEGYHWNPSDLPNIPKNLEIHSPVWKAAQEQQMEVIGLEPDFVLKNKTFVYYTNRDNEKAERSIWGTLEGVRIRNERWNKLLAAYREKNPDALFIIYTGAGHSLYNLPFSLAQTPAGGAPYVVAFYPKQMEVMDFSENIPMQIITEKTGPLERLSGTVNFPQKVLYWDSAVLSRVSGFNARIKVDVNLLKDR